MVQCLTPSNAQAGLALSADAMPDPYAHYTPWGERLLIFTAADLRRALARDRWEEWQLVLMDRW